MNCYVYKGERKEDHYLYLPEEFDQQTLSKEIPAGIFSLMGELSLVIEFDLTPERQLPQADAQHVIDSLVDNGFYLQMPKKDMKALEDEYFN